MEVEKRSKDKKKAPEGTFKEQTSFGDSHGKVFDRLGLDLLQVTDDGKAVVHGDRDRVEQLYQRSQTLDSLGAREQARWATIDTFETVPLELLVDVDWLSSLHQQQPSDIVIELQPVLSRVAADIVLRAIADLFAQQRDEKLTGTGTDFSGRYWFRGRATRRSVRAVARDFFSVQAIHSPLYSLAAAQSRSTRQTITVRTLSTAPPLDARSLPCVALMDLGVAADHKQLAAYRRGQYVAQNAPTSPIGDHGAFVASRIILAIANQTMNWLGPLVVAVFTTQSLDIHWVALDR